MTAPTALPDVLNPGEAARALGVVVKTLTRWAREGKVDCFRTVGGHRRYRREEVERLRAEW